MEIGYLINNQMPNQFPFGYLLNNQFFILVI